MNKSKTFLQQTSRYFSTTFTNREKQQFLVIAKDFTDSKALDRRMGVREQHLVVARQSKADNIIRTGGAILNSQQKMEGSFLLLNADSLEEAEKIVTNDIYHTAKVWENYVIYPIKIAPLSKD